MTLPLSMQYEGFIAIVANDEGLLSIEPYAVITDRSACELREAVPVTSVKVIHGALVSDQEHIVVGWSAQILEKRSALIFEHFVLPSQSSLE